MATEKQVKYLCVLAKKLDVKKEWDKWKDMPEKEASKLIEEMEGMSKEIKQSSTTEVNGIRFGMACKLVIQEFGCNSIQRDPKFMANYVLLVYTFLEETERSLKGGSK